MVGPGKLEAYFFPPLHVPTYNMKMARTISRLGFKPSVTRDDVVTALRAWGTSDRIYELLNVFEIKPNEGWHIPEGEHSNLLRPSTRLLSLALPALLLF